MSDGWRAILTIAAIAVHSGGFDPRSDAHGARTAAEAAQAGREAAGDSEGAEPTPDAEGWLHVDLGR